MTTGTWSHLVKPPRILGTQHMRRATMYTRAGDIRAHTTCFQFPRHKRGTAVYLLW
jgi:hypothetical protein